MIQHILHRLLVAGFAAEVITGCKQMTGVDADSKAFRITNMIHNVAQMFKPATQTCALPGSVFDCDGTGQPPCSFESFVERIDDPLKAFLFAVSHMSAGMQYNEIQSQFMTSANFGYQSLDRHFIEMIRSREID